MTRERPLSLALITCALSVGTTITGCTESMIRMDPDAGSTGDSGRPPGDSAVDPDGGTPPVDSGTSDSGPPTDSGPRDSGRPMGDGGMMPDCHEVTFTLERPGATSVAVSGSWIGWPGAGAGALPLVNDGTGTWSITTRIEAAGRISYKFIVDGSMWIADPTNPRGEPDGFGGTNSVLDVCDTPGGMCGDLSAFDWRDAVMYFVMTDRFRDSDSMAARIAGASRSGAASGDYEGGDLDGVTERLPYLAELGVTAIWLSAPYEGRDSLGAAIDPGSDPHLYSAYHGYWPSPADIRYTASGDLEAGSPEPEVESRIGDSLDLHELVDTAHATMGADGHGMKVLFDYVMKHVDEESGLRAAHPEWFVPLSDGMGSTLCGPRNYWDHPYYGTRCAFTNYLPSFDFYQEAPRQWSVRDAAWWAREYGIDGYRLDAIKHVPLSWLTELRTRIDSEVTAPEGDRFYMVGETFAYDDRELLRRFVDPDTMLDGQFDFPFKARVCEALFRPEGRLDGFASWMDGNDGFYGAGAIMSTWIGNHDIPRAIHFASGQITDCRAGSNPGNGWSPGAFAQPTDAAPYQRLGLAFVVMMTNPGVPLIYYGDEIGLAGGGDPDNRRMMPWEESSLNEHQRALRDTVRALGRIRGENLVLGRGERTTLSSSQDTWVYRMSGCESADVIVAINRADGANTVTVPDGAYTDLVTGADATGGSISLSGRSFRILRVR